MFGEFLSVVKTEQINWKIVGDGISTSTRLISVVQYLLAAVK